MISEFIQALAQYRFLQYALITGLLASVACGVVGTYVVTRRIATIAGAIAHTVLAGLGAARYLQTVHGWDWLDPLYGAIAVSLAAAALIGWISLRYEEREDTVIGALWAIGMAVGILFISATPGYNQELMSYLFGNILMVSRSDLVLLAILDAIVVGAGALFYNQLFATAFDDEFARLRGLNVPFYYILLLCLTALTVVLVTTVVGVVMVIALVTLPAAIAGRFARRLWQMMVVAVLLSAAFTTTGLAISYGPDLPSGATIIVVAGVTYIAVAVGKSALSRGRRRR